MELKKGYKLTEVGVIPEDWEVGKIENLCSITTGDKNTQDKIDNGLYPFFVRSQTIERINSYSFDGEAVLTAGDGVGTGKIFHYINGKFDFHQRVYKMSNFENRINSQYFYLYFSGNFYDRITSLTAKSSVDSVRREMIANMKISIPPLQEQTAIATALSDTDALIQSLNALIAKKRLIKQGTMQALLTPPDKGGRRLEGFSGEWERNTLGDVCDLIDPHPSHRAPEEVKMGIPFLGIGDLSTNGFIVKKKHRVVDESVFYDHQSRYNLEEGLLGLGRVASIGKVVKLRTDIGKFAISPTLSIVRPHGISRNLLYYILNSKYVKDYFLKIMSGSTRSSVGMMVLRKVPLMLPTPLAEQTAIATILSDMDKEIESLERKRSKYERIKEGMMQELLTGKIRLV